MSATSTPEQKVERRAALSAVRAERADAQRRSRERAIVRRRLTLQLLAVSSECPCCGTTMEDVGPQDRRPQLVDGNPPSIVCMDCWRRLVADCERRSRDTGGKIPMPVVADELAEIESEVRP